MIYLFAGEDAKTRHEAFERFLKSLPTGADVLSIGKNDFDEMQFESLASGAGLFSPKSVVVLSGTFENESAREFILKKLELAAGSANDFAFVEGKLLKPVLERFKDAGADIKIFDKPADKKERFNSFQLASAFGLRDKLNLWIYFRMAMDQGVGMEELVGVLFWKAKDMLVKRSYGKFSEQELKHFAGRISYLLPEARRKALDDESAFEQFLLEAF
ncbi:MAG: hypothetical protein WDN09_00935 [bacterium]